MGKSWISLDKRDTSVFLFVCNPDGAGGSKAKFKFIYIGIAYIYIYIKIIPIGHTLFILSEKHTNIRTYHRLNYRLKLSIFCLYLYISGVEDCQLKAIPYLLVISSSDINFYGQ